MATLHFIIWSMGSYDWIYIFLFSYFEISHVTMILANGLFITGTYLTFLASLLREDCKSLEKVNYGKKNFNIWCNWICR